MARIQEGAPSAGGTHELLGYQVDSSSSASGGFMSVPASPGPEEGFELEEEGISLRLGVVLLAVAFVALPLLLLLAVCLGQVP